MPAKAGTQNAWPISTIDAQLWGSLAFPGLLVYQRRRMSKVEMFKRFGEVLRQEAAAIESLAGRIDRGDVERAIELLANCRGKIVVLGLGKSGIIAQKIAATMTSTGTAAIYLHPSDALHGGLGIIGEGDAVIALSNSGETDEVVALLPVLAQRQVPVIAILGKLDSTLARRADVVLDASVPAEACPFNLAPTTSTTVALAIGDALALTLMEVKGWTEADFAQNHPAGQLGKRLTLRVADLMHGGDEHPKLAPGAKWLEIIAAITKGGLGAANVIDEDGGLAGIITDGDLRRAVATRRPDELETLDCVAMMTRQPVLASPELLAYDALRLMEDRPAQISVLPVVDAEGKCVGLIRLHDIVRSGL
jgi:arabinose-5-phosphate isomerase